MEKRLNFNKEVDDLTKINDFFQNAETQTEYKVTETYLVEEIQPIKIHID